MSIVSTGPGAFTATCPGPVIVVFQAKSPSPAQRLANSGSRVRPSRTDASDAQ
jgi:hypothetical protein